MPVCLGCEHAGKKRPRRAREESAFCSDKCGLAFAESMQGPIQCVECDLEIDSVKEAKANGWKCVEPCPEGLTYNWSGYCPDCEPPSWEKCEPVQADLF